MYSKFPSWGSLCLPLGFGVDHLFPSSSPSSFPHYFIPLPNNSSSNFQRNQLYSSPLSRSCLASEDLFDHRGENNCSYVKSECSISAAETRAIEERSSNNRTADNINRIVINANQTQKQQQEQQHLQIMTVFVIKLIAAVFWALSFGRAGIDGDSLLMGKKMPLRSLSAGRFMLWCDKISWDDDRKLVAAHHELLVDDKPDERPHNSAVGAERRRSAIDLAGQSLHLLFIFWLQTVHEQFMVVCVDVVKAQPLQDLLQLTMQSLTYRLSSPPSSLLPAMIILHVLLLQTQTEFAFCAQIGKRGICGDPLHNNRNGGNSELGIWASCRCRWRTLNVERTMRLEDGFLANAYKEWRKIQNRIVAVTLSLLIIISNHSVRFVSFNDRCSRSCTTYSNVPMIGSW